VAEVQLGDPVVLIAAELAQHTGAGAEDKVARSSGRLGRDPDNSEVAFPIVQPCPMGEFNGDRKRRRRP
ncbi:MAG: hypothetical protein AAF658_13775, partial [Myxococcota bacterium]